MSNEPGNRSPSEDDRPVQGKPGRSVYSQRVGDMAERKIKSQRHVTRTVWSGLGMMGLIGWSVALPTVIGAGLGLWLDNQYPAGRSWTLMLLVVGLCLGCFNAWRWIDKEDKDIHHHEDGDHAD